LHDVGTLYGTPPVVFSVFSFHHRIWVATYLKGKYIKSLQKVEIKKIHD
jgi:hypothetical protein